MNSSLHTDVCDLLGCAEPLFLAGMGGVSRAGLVAAVRSAGGFGFLGMVREPVERIAAEVAAVRAQGITNFGVNLIPAATPPDLLQRQIDCCIALDVPVVALFWDIDAAIIARLRTAGIKVVHQVGSTADAMAAIEAGVDALIAQGVEAGGHVRGSEPLTRLLPGILAHTDLPVIAAGGLVTGNDLIAALGFGAQGVCMGTAFIATRESFAHDYHKQQLVLAGADATVLTDRFHINWPAGANVRVLKSSLEKALSQHNSDNPQTVIAHEDGRPIYLMSTDSPLHNTMGDITSMPIYAGKAAPRIQDIIGAEALTNRIVQQAKQTLDPDASSKTPPEVTSGVCYAGEFSGHYMGQLEPSELADRLGDINCNVYRAMVSIAQDTPYDAGAFSPDVVQFARSVLTLERHRKRLQHPAPEALDWSARLMTGGPHKVTGMLRDLAGIVRATIAETGEEAVKTELQRIGDLIERQTAGSSIVQA